MTQETTKQELIDRDMAFYVDKTTRRPSIKERTLLYLDKEMEANKQSARATDNEELLEELADKQIFLSHLFFLAAKE